MQLEESKFRLSLASYIVYRKGPVRAYFHPVLGDDFVSKFLAAEKKPFQRSSHSREGSFLIEVADKKIVCKSYKRGGLPGIFLNDQHFACSRDRGLLELFWTDFLAARGLSVPEPLFALTIKKGIYKKLYYGSTYVPSTSDLSALNSPETAYEVGKIAKKILDLGLQLTDLHPANVLCKESGDVVLVDFDKVRTVKEGEDKKDELFLRWRRACLKRETRDLIAPFREGLFA